jgi:hypothetical protein
MVANLTMNPILTTNAGGTFTVTFDGYMQGMAMDDPAMRNQLTGGLLAESETIPMFGGIPITESIPAPVTVGTQTFTMDPALNTIVTRATTAANMTGISVFNQNHAALNTPQSQVPQSLSGMIVMLYRFGSLARIPLAADPALIATLAGIIISPTALLWDATNQWITSAAAGGAGIALPVATKLIGFNAGNSMTVVYDPVTGYSNWNRQGNAVLLQI